MALHATLQCAGDTCDASRICKVSNLRETSRGVARHTLWVRRGDTRESCSRLVGAEDEADLRNDSLLDWQPRRRCGLGGTEASVRREHRQIRRERDVQRVSESHKTALARIDLAEIAEGLVTSVRKFDETA